MKTLRILFFLLSAHITLAQEFRSGVTLGIGYPTHRTTFPVEIKNFIAGCGGAQFQFIKSNFSINLNVLLDRRVYKSELFFMDETGQPAEVTTYISLDNVTIPLYAGLHFGKNRRIFVNMGVSCNSVFHQRIRNQGLINKTQSTITPVEFLTLFAGPMLGGGYSFRCSDLVNFNIELRTYQDVVALKPAFIYFGDVMLMAGILVRTGDIKKQN